MDTARVEQPHDHAGGAQVFQTAGLLEHVDHVLDRPGVREGRRGALDDAGPPPALLLQFEPRHGVGEFLGGVADDADEAQRPAARVAADGRLGVGPAQGAVAAPDPEVRAVAVAVAADRLPGDGVQPGALAGRQPVQDLEAAAVVLVVAQIEDLQRHRVQMEPAGAQVPVETAHPVEGQAPFRLRGPVVGQRQGSRLPIDHGVTLSLFVGYLDRSAGPGTRPGGPVPRGGRQPRKAPGPAAAPPGPAARSPPPGGVPSSGRPAGPPVPPSSPGPPSPGRSGAIGITG